MPTLHLVVDRDIDEPLHRQVREGLRRAILEGRLRPGQRLPSTRILALDLGVSRLPVLSAYEQLLHEGYLVGRTGSGTFVSDAVPDELLRPASVPDTMARKRTGPERPALSGWNFPIVPFQVGLPALDLFPHATWKTLVVRQLNAESAERMSYTDPAGLEALRTSIAEHIRSARAVRCEASQVLIVPGSQAALRLAASVLLEPGDRVAIEEPGYFGAHRAFRAAAAELVPVPVDEEGLNVAALRRRGARVRAVYVTPSHQYPLGVTMSAARRFALLEWAKQQKAWILEDDYDSEFRYVSRARWSFAGNGRARSRDLRRHLQQGALSRCSAGVRCPPAGIVGPILPGALRLRLLHPDALSASARRVSARGTFRPASSAHAERLPGAT